MQHTWAALLTDYVHRTTASANGDTMWDPIAVVVLIIATVPKSKSTANRKLEIEFDKSLL